MTFKIKLLIPLLLTLLLCNCNPKKDISVSTYLSFIGHELGYEKSFLKEPIWIEAGPVKNDDYNITFTYGKKESPMEYVSIDKCDDNNSICRVFYSITEKEYSDIPPELKKLGFEFLDEDDSNGVHHISYAKSKTYDISAILNKVKKNSGYRYSMEIRVLVLPPDLIEKIKNKNQ